MKKLTLILSILLWQCTCLAQDIKGFVVDDSNKPLQGIQVYNASNGLESSTDSLGFFSMENETYPVDLLFISDGYHMLVQSIKSQNTQIQSFTLRKLSIALTEVLIRERRKIVFGLKSLKDVEHMSIYAGKKTEVVLLESTLGNLASNNPRQIYAQVVGLNIYEGNDAGLQLNIGGRGLDPNRTANFNTRQNDYDISADVLGYPESYYTPPAEALKEVQIVRGAASLQYGTQFGGLVNFKLMTPPKGKKLSILSKQTIGSFGLFTSFNRIAGSSNKWSYQAYTNIKKGDGFRPNSDFISENFFAQLSYQLTSKTKLSCELTYFHYLAQQAGGLTDAQFYEDPTFSNRSRNHFEVDWLLYNAKLRHTFNDATKISIAFTSLNASRKAVGFRTNRVSQIDNENFVRDLILGDFGNYSLEGKFLSQYPIGRRHVIFLLGAKWYQSENSAIQGPGSASSGPDFELATTNFPFYPNQSNFLFPNKNFALFSEHIFKWTKKLSITPGLRWEHIRTAADGDFRRIDFDLAGNPIRDASFEDDRVLNRSFLLFGVGMAYKANRSFEAYGNFSENYRSVTFNDIRTINPSFQVDSEIRDESGYTIDIGFRGQINSVFSYDLGVYTLAYKDRIGEVLGKQTTINAEGEVEETGRILRTRGNIGKAQIYGLEAFAEWNIHKSIDPNATKYSLSIFTNLALTSSSYKESAINGIKGNEVEFIPDYNIKTGIRFGYKDLLTSLQWTTIGTQFTDASNALQDVSDNQRGIEGSIPAYQILDWSFSYKWNPFTLETGINNLLDTSYFTRRATGYPGPGIIPSDPRGYYLTIGYRY